MKDIRSHSSRDSRTGYAFDVPPTVLIMIATLFSSISPMVKLLYQDHMVQVALAEMGRKLRPYQLNLMIVPSKCTNG